MFNKDIFTEQYTLTPEIDSVETYAVYEYLNDNYFENATIKNSTGVIRIGRKSDKLVGYIIKIINSATDKKGTRFSYNLFTKKPNTHLIDLICPTTEFITDTDISKLTHRYCIEKFNGITYRCKYNSEDLYIYYKNFKTMYSILSIKNDDYTCKSGAIYEKLPNENSLISAFLIFPYSDFIEYMDLDTIICRRFIYDYLKKNKERGLTYEK